MAETNPESLRQNTGLLIEGRTVNLLPDSDRLRDAITEDLDTSILVNGAPTTDLLRAISEAGPIVRTSTTSDWSELVVEQDINATVEDAGCTLAGFTGHTVGVGDVGKFFVGSQELLLNGRVQISVFSSEVLSVDVPAGTVRLATAVFTVPTALTTAVSNMFLTTAPPTPGSLKFQDLVRVDELMSFSIYARHASRNSYQQGIAIEYLDGAVLPPGPVYSSQQALFLPALRALAPPLGGFTLENRVLTAEQDGGSPDVNIGDLLEIFSTGAPSGKAFFVEEADNGDPLTCRLRDVTGQTTVFGDLDVGTAAIAIRDMAGTYQGFQRVLLEVPDTHRETTAPIPPPLSSGVLTLSHYGDPVPLSDLTVAVVALDSSLITLPEDGALAGISYRLLPVGGFNGRAAIEVSEGAKTAFEGLSIRVSYGLPYGDRGTIRIYPRMLANPEGYPGSRHPTPPTETECDLWRGQWEVGPMSSSLPTPRSESRAREPDRVWQEGGGLLIPRGEAELLLTFCPSYRSPLLREGTPLTLWYSTDQLVLSIVKEADNGARIRLSVAGTDFDSDVFDYTDTDRLDFVVGWTSGSDVTMRIARNGVALFETHHAGPVPEIDDSVRAGAKIWIGSRPDGTLSCFGRIQNVSLKDKRS